LKEKQITTNTKLPKATFFFSIKSKTWYNDRGG
jgi:hypothetical protein